MKSTLMTTVFATSILVAGTASGETGMGMVVEINDTTNMAGKARRIDLKDGKIVNTSKAFGSGIRNGRISPDGTRVVTVNRSKKVEIWDLSGNLKSSFTTFEGQDAYVSWTKNGSGRQSIWVGGIGKVVRYNTSGAIQETLTLIGGGSGATAMTNTEAAETKVKTVSFDERTAGGRPKFAASVLLDTKSGGKVKVIKLGSGCSVGPSPNGQRLTRNLWEAGVEHQTMTIHDRKGAQTNKFYIYDLIYTDTPTADRTHATRGYTWNRQTWPSNSNDIILLPAGHCFKQMTAGDSNCSTMPWIYNMATKKAFCLYDANGDGTPDCKTKNKWWYIFDFHRGKISSNPECTGPSQCSDGDVCTQDVCTASFECDNPPIAGCCTSPSQCSDGDVCTKDVCTASHQCDNPPIAKCCTGPSQCSDGDICTKDICSANTCDNPPIANCCTGPSQCNDSIVCTEDKCVDNQCDNPPISGCCKLDGDCSDGNPCTTNTCNKSTGECSKQTIANCCQRPADCDDGDICTENLCDPSNQCDNPPIAKCCESPTECDDGLACTTNTCDSYRCKDVAVLDCCEGPEDCVDEDDCTEDVCNASNQCDNPPISGCVVQPSVDLATPQGGDVWEPGSTASIKWATKKITEVVLYLSKDGGATWDSIGKVDDTEGNWGDYQYAVPSDLESDACMVMVEDYDQLGSAKSGVFAIRQGGTDPVVPVTPSARQRGFTDGGSVLVGGCAIAADGPATGPTPWLLVLIFISWVTIRRFGARRR